MMTNLEVVTNEAIDVFGSQDKAQSWLTTYHAVLLAKPIDYLESQNGFLIVMQILNSIRYGGVV